MSELRAPGSDAPNAWARAWALFRELSKSGIVSLVLISVLGGYFAGQSFERRLEWLRLLQTLLGVFFLASGSSALNQLQEWRIDSRMARTAARPIPSGRLEPKTAAVFCAGLIAIGLIWLATLDANLAWLGLAAVISYNGLYTLWWKPRWSYAAIPGAIPGALPILMGYVAADGHVFTPGGIYLFALLFFWQMPHFWVLAIRYRQDYADGGFPTLPVTHGQGITVGQITVWCLAYVALAMGARLFLPTGAPYQVLALVVSLKVLIELYRFARASAADQNRLWLRFFLWINFSLIFYIGGIAADLWSIHLVRYFT